MRLGLLIVAFTILQSCNKNVNHLDCYSANAASNPSSLDLVLIDSLILRSHKYEFETRPEFTLIETNLSENNYIVYNAFSKRLLNFSSNGHFINTIGHPGVDSIGYFGCSSLIVEDEGIIISDYANARAIWYDLKGNIKHSIPIRKYNYLHITKGSDGKLYAFSPIQNSPLPTIFIYNKDGSKFFYGIEPDLIIQDSLYSMVQDLSLLDLDKCNNLYFTHPLYYKINIFTNKGKKIKSFHNRNYHKYQQIGAFPRRGLTKEKLDLIFESLYSHVDNLLIFDDLLFVSLVNRENRVPISRWIDIYTLDGKLIKTIDIPYSLRLVTSSNYHLIFMETDTNYFTNNTILLLKYAIKW